jgi:DNA polymerase-3 subunit epsilon
METYSYWGGKHEPPANLKTKKQLAEMGLKPLNPVGVIDCKKYDLFLYDPENPQSAAPKKAATSKQLEALKKGRKKQEFNRAYREWYKETGRHLDRKNEAIEWAKSVLDEFDKWVILDTETTGFFDAEIVQIGIITLLGEVILDSYVKPTIPIPSEASAIHGITDEMVANSPDFPSIYPKIQDALEGKSVIIYNSEFDIATLEYCCELSSLSTLELKKRAVCLMKFWAIFYGQWSNYYDGYVWQPLVGGDHTAIGDCQASFKLIELMASSQIVDTSRESFRERFFQDNP